MRCAAAHNDEGDTDDESPQQRAERRAAERDGEKPWRKHMKPREQWEERERGTQGKKAAAVDAPLPTWGRPSSAPPTTAISGAVKVGVKAALTKEEAEKEAEEEVKRKFQEEEAKKAEVHEFILQSKAKWKQRIAEEKVALKVGSGGAG